RCESGRRLPPHAGPARPDGGRVRLRRDRDRRARPVQPVRGLPLRVPARRAPERRLRAPGSRLPVGARRRAPGLDPLLCSRWRTAPPLPRPLVTQAGRARGGDGLMLLAAGGINNSILVVVLASAVVYGTPLLYAALGELLAERSGVLNLGVEGMMLV